MIEPSLRHREPILRFHVAPTARCCSESHAPGLRTLENVGRRAAVHRAGAEVRRERLLASEAAPCGVCAPACPPQRQAPHSVPE